MTLLLTGLKAIELMANEGMRSVVVVQVGLATVKSGVCQTPPLTVATNKCFEFVGSTAMALSAPLSEWWRAWGRLHCRRHLLSGPGPLRSSLARQTK